MKSTIIVIVLCSLIGISYAGEEDVLDLVDSDFASRMKDIDTAVVMFYAPW